MSPAAKSPFSTSKLCAYSLSYSHSHLLPITFCYFRTPKKPKSKKANILAPSASVSAALSNAALPPSLASTSALSTGTNVVGTHPPSSSGRSKHEFGTQNSPIPLYSDGEDSRQSASAANGLKRKLSDGGSVSVNALVDGMGNGHGIMVGGASVAGDGAKKRRKVEIVSLIPLGVKNSIYQFECTDEFWVI